MSFVLTLVAVVVVLLILRLTVRALPLAWARSIRPRDAVAAGLGVIGLVLHCVAMFNRPLIDGLPGADPYIVAVNGMGGASIALYVVPAVLVLVGLHAQRLPWLVLLAAALLAVGITMYDGGSLAVHLTSIFVAVVLLALTSTFMITRVGGAVRAGAR